MASKFKILMSKFKTMDKNTEPSKTYVKNVGKSVQNVGVDLHEDFGAPITKVQNFKEAMNDTLSSDRGSQIKKVKATINNSQEAKLAKMYGKSVKTAVKTGKLYLSEDDRFEKEMSIMMGDLDGDEDTEQPLSEGPDTSVETAKGSFEAQAGLESASTNALISSAASNNAGLRSDVKVLTATNKASNSAVIASIGNVNNFNNTVFKSYIERTIKWQDSMLNMVTEQRDLMQKGMFNANIKYEAEAETQKTVADRVMSGDFKGAIGQMASGTIKSMDKFGMLAFKDMLPMMMSGAIANPLGFLKDKIKDKTGLGTLMDSNNIKDKINAAGFKLSNMSADKQGALGFIGQNVGNSILAGNAKAVNSTVDTSKFEKGKVQWDGIARKTLVDVIPFYLKKMTAVLTKGEEQVFDYNSGKFTTTKKLKAKIEGAAPSFKMNNQLYNMLSKYIDKSTSLYSQASKLYDGDYKDALQKATKDILTWLSANRLPLVVITQTSTSDLQNKGLGSVDELTMLVIKQALSSMNTKGESIKDVEANMKAINKINKSTGDKHKAMAEFNKSIRSNVRQGGAYASMFDGTDPKTELKKGVMDFRIDHNKNLNMDKLADAKSSNAFINAQDIDEEITGKKFSDDLTGNATKSIIASNVERILYGKPLNKIKPEDVPKIKEKLIKKKDTIKKALLAIPGMNEDKVNEYINNAVTNLQKFVEGTKYKGVDVAPTISHTSTNVHKGEGIITGLVNDAKSSLSRKKNTVMTGAIDRVKEHIPTSADSPMKIHSRNKGLVDSGEVISGANRPITKAQAEMEANPLKTSLDTFNKEIKEKQAKIKLDNDIEMAVTKARNDKFISEQADILGIDVSLVKGKTYSERCDSLLAISKKQGDDRHKSIKRDLDRKEAKRNEYRSKLDKTTGGAPSTTGSVSKAKVDIKPGLDLGKGNPNTKTDVGNKFVSQYDPSFAKNSLNVDFAKVGCGIAVALSALYRLGKAVDSDAELGVAKPFMTDKGVTFNYFRTMAKNNKVGYIERDATMSIEEVKTSLDKGDVLVFLVDQSKTKLNHYVLVHGYKEKGDVLQLIYDDPARGSGLLVNATNLMANTLKLAVLSKSEGLLGSSLGVLGKIGDMAKSVMNSKVGKLAKGVVGKLLGGAAGSEKKFKLPSFLKPKPKFKLEAIKKPNSMSSNELVHAHLSNITELLKEIRVSSNNSPSLFKRIIGGLNPFKRKGSKDKEGLIGGLRGGLRGGVSKLKNLGLDAKRKLSEMTEGKSEQFGELLGKGKAKVSGLIKGAKGKFKGMTDKLSNPFGALTNTAKSLGSKGRNLLKKLNPLERFKNATGKAKAKLELLKAKIEVKIEKIKLKKLQKANPSTMMQLLNSGVSKGKDMLASGRSKLKNGLLGGKRLLGSATDKSKGLLGKIKLGGPKTVGVATKVEIMNPVKLGGGFIDAVGSIRTIDQDVWASDMKQATKSLNSGMSKLKLKLPKIKGKTVGGGLITQSINKRQDGAFKEQEKQTALLSKLSGGGKKGDKKEKKGGMFGGLLGSFAKMIPMILAAIVPLLGMALFTHSGKAIAKSGMGMVNKVTGMKDGGEDASLNQTRNNIFRNMGKKFGLIGKKKGKAVGKTAVKGLKKFTPKNLAKSAGKKVGTAVGKGVVATGKGAGKLAFKGVKGVAKATGATKVAKAATGIVKNKADGVVKALMHAISALLGSKAVTKLVGPDIAKKLLGVSEKIAGVVAKKAKTGATKSLFSRFRSVSAFIPFVGQITEAAFITVDLIRGWKNANNYFGLKDKDTTIKMKSVSAIVSALQGLFSKGILMFISLIPAKWLVNVFYKFLGTDEEKKFIDEHSKAADSEYKQAAADYAKNNDGKKLTKDAFLDNKEKSTKKDEKKAQTAVKDNKVAATKGDDASSTSSGTTSSTGTGSSDSSGPVAVGETSGPMGTTTPVDGLSTTAQQSIISDLKRHEGFRAKWYYDSVGVPTIGYGMNLKVLPKKEREHYMKNGTTKEEGAKYLAQKVPKVWKQILSKMPWANDLDDVRKGVLVNMGFNMGVPGINKWKNWKASIKAGDYGKAADIMGKTLWSRQVGARATELTKEMRTAPKPIKADDKNGDVTAHANGGVFTKPHMAIVGDAPETIIPHKKTAESIALWKEAGKKLGQVNPSDVGRDESGIVGSSTSAQQSDNSSSLIKQLLRESRKQTAMFSKMIELLSANVMHSSNISNASTSQINKIANFTKMASVGNTPQKGGDINSIVIDSPNNGLNKDSGFKFKDDKWFDNIESIAKGK